MGMSLVDVLRHEAKNFRKFDYPSKLAVERLSRTGLNWWTGIEPITFLQMEVKCVHTHMMLEDALVADDEEPFDETENLPPGWILKSIRGTAKHQFENIRTGRISLEPPHPHLWVLVANPLKP